MLEIRDVRCDDWHWLYIDGELTSDGGVGHHLEPSDLVDAINTYLDSKSDGSYREQNMKIDFETWWVTGEYAEGGLPQYLKDIPEEVFE